MSWGDVRKNRLESGDVNPRKRGVCLVSADPNPNENQLETTGRLGLHQEAEVRHFQNRLASGRLSSTRSGTSTSLNLVDLDPMLVGRLEKRVSLLEVERNRSSRLGEVFERTESPLGTPF
jgi:hypothetical protein